MIKKRNAMHGAYHYWVYIVRCNDGKYYTGVTNNLDRRLEEHNNGINPDCYTYERRPVVLMYEEHFHDINETIAWEKQLKGWSRKKKEALFRRDIEEIKRLAKSKNTTSNSDTSSLHPSTSSG
jgi:putative endonuclease